MKKLLTLILVLCSTSVSSFALKKANPSTCTLLVEQVLEKLFAESKIQSMIEFGNSPNIQYFLDRCPKVDAYEILFAGQTEETFKDLFALFQQYPFSTFCLKPTTLALQQANAFYIREQRDPALYDATYILDLKTMCDDLFRNKQYEMAIVNPQFHMRGELINELFDRVPFILAYHVGLESPLFGWNKVNTPSNYQKIYCSQKSGLVLWVRKDKLDLIDPSYATLQKKKHLRIFFPQMHPILVQSMALALQYLGHTLLLPGESFDPHSAAPGFKLGYGTFFKKIPWETSSFTQFFSANPQDCDFLFQGVEVIENHELFANPPDVLFVNCLEVEQSIYAIWQYLKKYQKPVPKIAHYSGNNASHYREEWVKNLIAVDAYTAAYYDPSTTHIITWLPWIDFDHLGFDSFNDSRTLNTYISHYYGHFHKSAAAFYDVCHPAQRDFPGIAFELYPKSSENGIVYTPHLDLLSLIDQSCATMHIKETEGFGYTIIESLAKGRPVFLKRSFSLGSRLMNWCIEGKTAFFFEDYSEFQSKLHHYLDDLEYRHFIQRECVSTIRKLIDNQKQARILENFLQNLQ